MSEKKPFNIKLLIVLIFSCAAVYSLYRVLLSYIQPELVLIIYMAIATILILTYVIYNRGFSRKGITEDMLPQSWSEEKKQEFVESGKLRLKRSKPLLLAIITFIFTFFMDVMELIVIPFFTNMIGG